MSATRRERRAANRRVGRRELDRRARRLTVRVLVLSERGYSPTAIASSTGLAESTVLAVLEDPGEG